MKIKFNSDDNLPFKKSLELLGILVVIKSVSMMEKSSVPEKFVQIS